MKESNCLQKPLTDDLSAYLYEGFYLTGFYIFFFILSILSLEM